MSGGMSIRNKKMFVAILLTLVFLLLFLVLVINVMSDGISKYSILYNFESQSIEASKSNSLERFEIRLVDNNEFYTISKVSKLWFKKPSFRLFEVKDSSYVISFTDSTGKESIKEKIILRPNKQYTVKDLGILKYGEFLINTDSLGIPYRVVYERLD